MKANLAAALTLGLWTIWTSGVGAQVVATRPNPAPDLVFEDQWQNPHRMTESPGDVVVLIYGDRASASANKALGEQLHVLFHPAAAGHTPARARQAPVRPLEGAALGSAGPDVRVVAVACVGKVPSVVAALIRAQVRLASPDLPVWLDFQGQMKQQLGLAAGVPNLAVLDKSGRVRYQAAGLLNPDQLGQLAGLLESLRHE